MKFLCPIVLLLGVLPAASAQLAKVSDERSILGHPVQFDADHHVRSWYHPETPGAGYDRVIRLAAGFLLHHCPLEPKTGLPLYLVTSSFSRPGDAGGDGVRPDTVAPKVFGADWPHNPACIFAGAVQSFAVGYYQYTGDAAAKEIVRTMLDHQLAHGTTPAEAAWPGVPYASADPFVPDYAGSGRWAHEALRGDGVEGIEPDKVGELGYGYVRFYEISGESKYLVAARRCADALAAHVRDAGQSGTTLSLTSVELSPWPFRVNARTGEILSEYCSNVLDPVKLFDELLRLADRTALDPARRSAYVRARDLAWRWLYSRNGPMKTFIWNAYFEDVPNDPTRANRLQITPTELAKHLTLHPELAPNAVQDAGTLVRWVATAFKAEGWDAINEQTWCYEPMGSHTARYGAACALLFERTGEPYYKEQAHRYLNFATYMTQTDGYVAVGPTWPGAWWSDGYTDYVRHFIDALGAIPEWAPADENHLLRASSVVTEITYGATGITLATFDESPDLVFRLVQMPFAVLAGGRPLERATQPTAGAFTWTPLAAGGVLRMHRAPGRAFEIRQNP
jgi:hypothetical protein